MTIEPIIAYLVQKTSALIDVFLLEPERIVSHDRLILEETILPYLAQKNTYRNILFVGCSAYTRWYENFFHDREYWTIDPKRIKRKYGSKQHIVDSITNLDKHFTKDYFDVIIINGVIGFGLNQRDDIDRAIDACHRTMAKQGILLVGWNDTPRRIPIDLRSIHAFQRFREYFFEPLQSCHFRAEGAYRHTFSFYQKQ